MDINIILDFSRNPILPTELIAICNKLQTDTQIKTLNLFGNFMHSNEFKHIKKMLQRNTCLNELNLTNTNAIGVNLKYLAKGLKKNNTLTILNLSNNDIDNDLVYIAEILKYNSSLQELILSNNTIGINVSCGFIAMTNALKVNSSLKKLDLNVNSIDSEHITYICDALIPPSNCTLEHLNFNMNKIGLEGIKCLSKMLKSNATLKYLNISNNRENGQIINLPNSHIQHAKYLGEALEHNSTLDILHMHSNKIGDKGLKYLVNSLKKNKSLHYIGITSCGLTDKGITHICNALNEHSIPINGLNISQNNMGINGYKAICDVIRQNNLIKLGKLGFDYDTQLIGDGNVSYMCDALKQNTSLIGLDFVGNNIDASNLINTLINHPVLEHLTITGRNIKCCSEYVCELLQKNKPLRSLILTGTTMSLKEHDDITNTLQSKNSTIMFITLGHFYKEFDQICDRNKYNACHKNMTLRSLC